MKRGLIGLYLLISLWSSVVILLRRLAWHQIPTQVSAPVVYATVAINVLVAVWLVRRTLLRRG
jgi:hypothetical protein